MIGLGTTGITEIDLIGNSIIDPSATNTLAHIPGIAGVVGAAIMAVRAWKKKS